MKKRAPKSSGGVGSWKTRTQRKEIEPIGTSTPHVLREEVRVRRFAPGNWRLGLDVPMIHPSFVPKDMQQHFNNVLMEWVLVEKRTRRRLTHTSRVYTYNITTNPG